MISVDVPYPDTVQELAEALAEDRVIVQETRGSGDAAGAMERISRLVEQLPFEAYVAVIDAPPDVDAGYGASEYLATALSRRIGQPGLYVVSADGTHARARLVGTDWDETIFTLQESTNREAVDLRSGQSTLVPAVDAELAVRTALAGPTEDLDGDDRPDYDEPTLSDAVVDELADRRVDLQPYERPGRSDDPPEPWSPGKRWMVGVSVGAGLLLVLWQSIWGWPGWRRPRTDDPSALPTEPFGVPDIEQVRAQAEDELTALAEALPSGPQGDRLDRAVLAREVAEPLLRSDDVLDVVGALVLARGGRRELSMAPGRARRPSPVCFFDPRHVAATRTAEWRFGDSEVEVPVCPACQRAVARGHEPDSLLVRRGGRLRPYYEGDTVWARTAFGGLSTDLGHLASEVSAARRGSR
ncbi:MAG: hypothetical protein WBP61_18170 [Nocardioides sp.]